MQAILYILLGLSLGAGLTLITLQERFVRERRRLLALCESQRAKESQALVGVNKKLEQQCSELTVELQDCQNRLAAEAATSQPVNLEQYIDREEHECLMREKDVEKNADVARLTNENKTLAGQLADHQREISDLQGQLIFLKGELAKTEAEKQTIPGEDFVLLGQPGGHLLPGSVVRALIKGHKG